MKKTGWRQAGGRLEGWRQAGGRPGGRLEAAWRQAGSRLEAGFACLAYFSCLSALHRRASHRRYDMLGTARRYDMHVYYQQRLQRIRNDPEYQRRLQMIRDGEVDMSPPDDEEELPAQEMSGSGLQQDSPYETTFAPPGAGWVFSDPLMCARCARRRSVRTCTGACERDVCLGCLRWAPNTERCLLDARVCCIDCYNNGVDHRVPAPLHAQFVREQARRTLWSPDVATPLPSPPTPPADPRRNTARAADAPAEDAPAEDASAASGWQLWDSGRTISDILGWTFRAHTDVVPDEDVPARHSY